MLVAGCAGSSKSEPASADAKPFADSFVQVINSEYQPLSG
jgi:hypothetical protein